MLADIYNWYAEGFDTADLKESTGQQSPVLESSRRLRWQKGSFDLCHWTAVAGAALTTVGAA